MNGIPVGNQPEKITGPRLKVERARQHIADLETHIAEFHKRAPYLVVREEDPKTGDLVWRVRVREQPPPSLALLAGDAVHNLRTALDHLMWQLVLANGHEPDDQTMFPITANATRFRAGGPRRMKGASARAVAAIRAAKPYKGGNDLLWRLHRLDANDKHRLLYVVGAAHRSITLASSLPSPTGTGRVPLPKFDLHPADRQFPLRDGAELFLVRAAGRAGYAENYDEPEFSFEVALSDGEVVEGEPILQTLSQLADFTSGFIESFVSLLK
jgi:hypothetical protein